MDNDEVLGHLLKIEAEATALVLDAQTEADKRIAESEKQNRILYEEHYQNELTKQENKFQAFKKQIQQNYQEELDAYKEKISEVYVDTNAFSALLNKFITGEL